jgi:hypothetical protein
MIRENGQPRTRFILVTFCYESGKTSLLASPELLGRREPKPLRGAIRLLEAMGHGVLTEFPLKSGRRADILSLSGTGEIWIVEVKSGIQDFRSDNKWQGYLAWCDRFFFAAGPDFPIEILPGTTGLLVADSYEAVLVRESAVTPLAGATRKALTLRFAHLAARRLSGLARPIAG